METVSLYILLGVIGVLIWALVEAGNKCMD